MISRFIGLLACLVMAGCGSAPTPTEGQPLVVASPAPAPTAAPTETVRLTVKTNFPEADRYFVVDRISDAPSPEQEDWEAPKPALVNAGFEFFVDLTIGARYTIGLRQVVGANFLLPNTQAVDLRYPSASQLERTLEYGNLGESGQN